MHKNSKSLKAINNLIIKKTKGKTKMAAIIASAILMFAFLPFVIEGILTFRNA